jgi:hypothetical protein
MAVGKSDVGLILVPEVDGPISAEIHAGVLREKLGRECHFVGIAIVTEDYIVRGIFQVSQAKKCPAGVGSSAT